MARRVVFLVYPGFELLDLSGPVAVFNDANGPMPGTYDIAVVSADGGPVTSSSGIIVGSRRPGRGSVDTLMVPGGDAAAFRSTRPAMIRLLARLARGARRTASVCTGAFFLAEAGLLQGRSVTTHWKYAAELQAACAGCLVDADRIFIRDGSLWTSAGVTAGIDLALALIEEDLGAEISQQVARGLVVYHRRLGGQSQYSALLEMEPDSDRIRDALGYIRAHVRESLSVPRLAEVARLSVRQFSRAFAAGTGMSPARAIERVRAEVAKPHIEDSRKSLEEVARVAGFSNTEQMRQAFLRAYGRPPQSFRRQQHG